MIDKECKCDNCKCDKGKLKDSIKAMQEVRDILNDLSTTYKDAATALQGQKIDARVKRISELLEFLR
jgi:hypothetical protein